MIPTLLKADQQPATQDISHLGEDRLFSLTKKIDDIDPKSFYEANQKSFAGERIFWKSSDGEMVLAGLGAAYRFAGQKKQNRFLEAELAWEQALHGAVIENPYDVPGTGPILFGGFSFDSEGQKDEKWEAFGASLFYVPSFMVTEVGGETYLTITVTEKSGERGGKWESALKEAERLLEAESPRSGQPESSVIKQEELNPDKWKDTVGHVVALLNDSDMEKVVLARSMRLMFDRKMDSGLMIGRLLDQQPNSYVFAMEAEDSCFLGASPERLVKKIGENVLSTCLAGSIGRGASVEEDETLGNALLSDEKNRYEHQLVVSMIGDVLKRYCDEVAVPDHPVLMKMRDIQHLYTPVSGKIRPGGSLLQLVDQFHPTPALGGVPTKQAMAIIRHEEKMDRGFYGAPFGWMDYRGNGEFIVAIRSGLIKGREAYIIAGCGIVADSDPQAEFVETAIKFRPMLRSLGGESE